MADSDHSTGPASGRVAPSRGPGWAAQPPPSFVLVFDWWARAPLFHLIQGPQPCHRTQGKVRSERQLPGATLLRAFSQAGVSLGQKPIFLNPTPRCSQVSLSPTVPQTPAPCG